MRSRLWRCSSEQLRPALSSDILGKDLASDPALSSLLQQVISGQRAGAVDVAREGPPPAESAVQPVERTDGVQLGDQPLHDSLRTREQLPQQEARPAIPSTTWPVSAQPRTSNDFGGAKCTIIKEIIHA